MKHPDYPNVSSFKDKTGKTRYQFRGKDGNRAINHVPHTPEFDAAYQALIEGRKPTPAEVVRMPGSARPHSFDAAYRKLKMSGDWKNRLEASSRFMYALHIEEFLNAPVAEGRPERWGDGPVAQFKRRHVKEVLDRLADRPHKEKLMLVAIRKLIAIALDEEWTEVDPTIGIKRNPEADGHLAWPAEMRRRFEQFWPIGTPARTAYTLALWLGNRRSDVATLRWDQLTTIEIVIDGQLRQVEGFDFTQYKGRNRGKGDGKGTRLFLPLVPELTEALAPLPRTTSTVLTQERRPTQGYLMGTLTGRMARWTAMAGIPKGYCMHGLRKSLGEMLAECDASTRQLMDILGHRVMAHAELYSRSASQKRLAVQGMEKVVNIRRRG